MKSKNSSKATSSPQQLARIGQRAAQIATEKLEQAKATAAPVKTIQQQAHDFHVSCQQAIAEYEAREATRLTPLILSVDQEYGGFTHVTFTRFSKALLRLAAGGVPAGEVTDAQLAKWLNGWIVTALEADLGLHDGVCSGEAIEAA